MVASVCAVVGAAPSASAHAELVSSVPADGANVRTLPSTVRLTFSETVGTPAFVTLRTPGGTDVASGRARTRDAAVFQKVDPSAGPGRYRLSYQVTSADGHSISGTLHFTVHGSGAAGSDGGSTSDAGTLPATTSHASGGGLTSSQWTLLVGTLAVWLLALGITYPAGLETVGGGRERTVLTSVEGPGPTTGVRSAITPWLAGSTVVAVVVLVMVLSAGGGAPTEAPPGLPDAGQVTGWGLPVVRLLVDLAGFATVGLALVGSRVIHPGSATPDSALPAAGHVAALWAGLTMAQALLHVSEVRATPLFTTDLSSTGETVAALGRYPETQAMLVQAALATSVVLLACLPQRVWVCALALVVSLVAFVPQALVGHSATGGMFAPASLVVHVLAASLWVGGLAAMAWLSLRRRTPLADVLPRYSTLALCCVVVLAVSGVLNAGIRIDSPASLVGTSYGLVVAAKVAALVVLAGFGWLHRRNTVDRLRGRGRRRTAGTPAEFAALCAIELAVMLATVALAVALSRTPPPG